MIYALQGARAEFCIYIRPFCVLAQIPIAAT